MSFQAMAWAVKQKTGNAGQKLALIMLANYCNSHTGQCNPSHKRLADECSMGVSTLKAHLQALEEIGLLQIVHKSKDGVQLPNQYHLNLEGVGQNLAGGGSESDGGVGQNLATNLEVKPINKTILRECANRFDEFWKKYPKKVGKEAARKSFLKMVKTQSSFDEVLKALEWQTKSDQWLKDGGQFIPNPATYLNQGRWQDEPDGKSNNSNDFGCLL